MNFLKEKLDSLEERMLAITILATFIISVIVFSKFWIKLINTIWVHPIMSKLYGHELLIAIVYGAIIALYYYHKFKFTQYYNKNRVCYFGLLFLIYIICFFSKEWSYSLITDKTNFSAWTNLIFLVIIPEICLYFVCRKREGINYNPLLEIEKTEKTGDAYQRNGSCESVYKIVNTCFFEDQSFAVGITGSWGSGKTTYIKSLKDRFEDSKEDISIIDFEPWKNDNPSLIIKSFFALLKSKLKPYISNISIPIDKYVSSLLDCDDVSIKTKLLLKTFHMFSMADKKSPYDQIKECLVTTKHRVVVFIDDIDRLDKSEIKEVLRLIRNTANFPYIQFVVAYDKDYVISTLKDSSIDNPSIYLEKFFNLEITLPKYESRIICSELERRLYNDINELGFKNMNQTVSNMINSSSVKDDEVQEKLISRVLTNVRDVIRFRNAFYISIHTIKNLYNQNEIGIVDLFYLELLRYRYNDVYMILRNRPTRIVTSDVDNTLDYGKESLNSIINSFSYNAYDKDIIKDIFDCLFHNISNVPSFSNKRYFANYFMLRPDDKFFTEMDFVLLSGLNEPELSQQAEKMYKNKYIFGFKPKISEILRNIYIKDSFENETKFQILDYVNIYGTLMSLLNSPGIKSKDLKNEIGSAVMAHLECLNFYDEKHFKSMLELYNYLDLRGKSSDYFIQDFLLSLLSKRNLYLKCQSVNIDKLAVIVVDFFKNINDVVIMSNAISQFLESVRNEEVNIDDFVIGLSTLSKIKFDYFINYNNKLSDNGFILFGNCIYYTDTDKVHLVNKTLEVMRTEIEEKPESYLSNFIHKGSSDDYTNSLYPETYFLIIFGSYENFDKFLESHKSLPSYKRVFRYWQLYKFNDNRPVIFDKQTNVDDVLANNLENEWDSFMQLKNIIQKYKNSPVSLKGIKNAVNSVNSNIQWEYSFILEKLQREYNN